MRAFVLLSLMNIFSLKIQPKPNHAVRKYQS